jgi:hypothetical protein
MLPFPSAFSAFTPSFDVPSCRSWMLGQRIKFMGDAPEAEAQALGLLAHKCATCRACDLAPPEVTAAPAPDGLGQRRRSR